MGILQPLEPAKFSLTVFNVKSEVLLFDLLTGLSLTRLCERIDILEFGLPDGCAMIFSASAWAPPKALRWENRGSFVTFCPSDNCNCASILSKNSSMSRSSSSNIMPTFLEFFLLLEGEGGSEAFLSSTATFFPEFFLRISLAIRDNSSLCFAWVADRGNCATYSWSSSPASLPPSSLCEKGLSYEEALPPPSQEPGASCAPAKKSGFRRSREDSRLSWFAFRWERESAWSCPSTRPASTHRGRPFSTTQRPEGADPIQLQS
mmetsp:Transcript_29133/g.73835  ORF Transcript_29133/g.73835 Transcript_29133/m.73835 type:complete len:262 (+) Transcript_29133:643-1428(+)